MNRQYARIETIVTTLLSAARQPLAGVRIDKDADVPEFFAAALVLRMASLLEGALLLCREGSWDVSRALGRALKEAWFYSQYLTLGGDDAVDTLFGEQASADRRLAQGIATTQELVGLAAAAVRHSRGEHEPRRANLKELAETVAGLREEHGIGGNVARGTYEMWYRYESGRDVHPSVEMVFRYCEPDGGLLKLTERPMAQDDVEGQKSAWDGLYADAELLTDAIGVLFPRVGLEDDVEALKEALAGL